MPDLLELLGLRDPWVRDAACSWDDYPQMAPIIGGEPTQDELAIRHQAAQRLCACCPVIATCAAAADRFGDVGVRGGSLRYRVGGDHGEYRVRRLVAEAMPSVHEREVMAGRLARKRALVGGGVR